MITNPGNVVAIVPPANRLVVPVDKVVLICAIGLRHLFKWNKTAPLLRTVALVRQTRIDTITPVLKLARMPVLHILILIGVV